MRESSSISPVTQVLLGLEKQARSACLALQSNCSLFLIYSCKQPIRHFRKFKKPLRQKGFLVSAEGLEPSTP